MTGTPGVETIAGATVLVADADAAFRHAAMSMLKAEGCTVICTTEADEMLDSIKRLGADLVLLDVELPGKPSRQLAREIRDVDDTLPVVLLLHELDTAEALKTPNISGYHDKQDDLGKLRLAAHSNVKATRALRRLSKVDAGQRLLLKIMPRLQRSRPYSELLDDILQQGLRISGLLASTYGTDWQPLASGIDAFIATLEDGPDLVLQASIGRFVTQLRMADCVTEDVDALIRSALERSEVVSGPVGCAIPLAVAGVSLGVMYWSRDIEHEDTSLVTMFAHHASAAMRAAQLYQLAALDPLTGAHARRFFEQWLVREVRAAYRSRQPVSLLRVQVRGFDEVNDVAGHAVGDRLLRRVARRLRSTLRETDVIGRYRTNEFVVVLPNANTEGARDVARRVRAVLMEAQFEDLPDVGSLALVVGIATLSGGLQADETLRAQPKFFSTVGHNLLQVAEASLTAHDLRDSEQPIAEAVTLSWVDLLNAEARSARPSGAA